MRVLLLNRGLSDRGGADHWLLGVLARLQGRADTRLAVGFVDAALSDADRQRIGPWQQIKGLDRGGLGRTAGPAARARLQSCIDEFAPDAIQVNDVMDPELLEVVASTGRGIAMVQDHRFFCPGRGKVDPDDQPCAMPMNRGCLGCFEDSEYGERMLDLTRRRLGALSRMARITVLSYYMASELQAVGLDLGRIDVIPPFVDGLVLAPELGPGQGEHHLLAGRLSSHKGVSVALEAASLLQTGLPLVVAGQGRLAENVRRAAEPAGSRVRFTGWADRPRLAELLGRARSLWLPSLWAEPFGIVGLEAMTAGVPVIAADVGGVRDWLIPGRTGLLVDAGDAAALARAADRLADEPDLARELGRNGRALAARDFEPEAQIDRLLAVYEAVAAAGPGRTRA